MALQQHQQQWQHSVSNCITQHLPHQLGCRCSQARQPTNSIVCKNIFAVQQLHKANVSCLLHLSCGRQSYSAKQVVPLQECQSYQSIWVCFVNLKLPTCAYIGKWKVRHSVQLADTTPDMDCCHSVGPALVCRAGSGRSNLSIIDVLLTNLNSCLIRRNFIQSNR